jgi:uncharacterized damage-inducible protein DinB
MADSSSVDPRYPIGKFEPQPYNASVKEHWLRDLKFLPNDVELAIHNMDEAQLHTPYREGGWTVHQLVHHIADSHMNAYIRFRLGLTEDNPTITPYDENAWVQLNDVATEPINVSITLLHALHRRWLATIKDLDDETWQRSIYHPGQQRQITLWNLLGIYAWHGKHHVAHITALRERMGW